MGLFCQFWSRPPNAEDKWVVSVPRLKAGASRYVGGTCTGSGSQRFQALDKHPLGLGAAVSLLAGRCLGPLFSVCAGFLGDLARPMCSGPGCLQPGLSSALDRDTHS